MAKKKRLKGANGFSNLKPSVTRSARRKFSNGLKSLTRKMSTVLLAEIKIKSLSSMSEDLDNFFKKQVWWEEEGQALVESTVNGLDEKMKIQFYKDLAKMLGVETNPIIKELGLQPELTRVVNETIEGIDSLKSDIQTKTQKIINEHLVTNRSIDKGTLGSRLAKVVNLSTKQTKNLARSMTAKVNGTMNQARMSRVGINQYAWSTSNDVRVRPSHKAANKKVYNVGEDVMVDVPKEGRVNIGHPGFDWGCRCVAIPLLDEA